MVMILLSPIVNSMIVAMIVVVNQDSVITMSIMTDTSVLVQKITILRNIVELVQDNSIQKRDVKNVQSPVMIRVPCASNVRMVILLTAIAWNAYIIMTQIRAAVLVQEVTPQNQVAKDVRLDFKKTILVYAPLLIKAVTQLGMLLRDYWHFVC